MGFFQTLLGHSEKTLQESTHQLPLSLHNTLSGNKEVFTPKGSTVRMYNCGPTVYGEQHIGNLSMFVFTDILRRTLEFNGYPVKQVINITDVGHLVSDGDDGEDKMTKGLKREGLALSIENMKKLAEKYASVFFKDLTLLNIDTGTISFPRATDHIPGQIALTQTLVEKGYAYKAKDGVYYDTSLFKNYGKLGNINLKGLEDGARVAVDNSKKHPADFALWKFNNGLGWEAPWGKGFPGWHIECSAMCRSELGEQIDIHTGGIEHIPIHHNNEIAQSEAAFGKEPFSRFWLHREHVMMNGAKIAKSDGNVVYLSEIIEKGFHPLALRYWLLTSHYRTPSNFTYEALAGAQTALLRLRSFCKAHPTSTTKSVHYERLFHEKMNDDLDTPGALATLWTMTKEISLPEEIAGTLIEADRVLGLRLSEEDAGLDALAEKEKPQEVKNLPEDIQGILKEREVARSKKDWAQSDTLRDTLEKKGFAVRDEGSEQKIYKK